MAYTFNSFRMSKLNKEFTSKEAIGVMDAVLDDALTDKEKILASNDVANLISGHSEQFAAALADGSIKNEELTGKMLSAIEFNPQNIQLILNSALKIERTSKSGDTNILTTLADKLISKFKYKHSSREAISQTKAILTTLNKHVEDYGKTANPDLATYEKIHKIYDKAYPIVPSILPISNKLGERIGIMKAGYKRSEGNFEKIVEFMQKNPDKEEYTDMFEQELKSAMNRNPQKAVETVMNTVKGISQIANDNTRGDMYGIILGAMEGIPAKDNAESEAKSAKVMAFINKAMKAEKNPEIKERMAVSAMYALHNGLCDENGGLIIAAGQENQAFGALNKLAETAGHRTEIREILAATADKYRTREDISEKVKDTMKKALAFADTSKKEMAVEHEKTMFEKRMRNVYRQDKNVRRLNTEICALLNLNYPDSDYKFDINKHTFPSKKEMEKAINKLSEYSQISGYLPDLIINKIDKEKFSNIDDVMLDKFEKATGRIKSEENRENVVSKLMDVRKNMHSMNVRKKNKIVFSKDDYVAPDGVDLEKLAEKKTPADHAPKKFNGPFNDDIKKIDEGR